MLCYYAAFSGNFLRTFRENPEDGTDVVSKRRQEIATTRCVMSQISAVLICCPSLRGGLSRPCIRVESNSGISD
jgi:hypothetical protein